MRKIIGKGKYDKKLHRYLKMLVIKQEYRIHSIKDIRYYEDAHTKFIRKKYYVQ